MPHADLTSVPLTVQQGLTTCIARHHDTIFRPVFSRFTCSFEGPVNIVHQCITQVMS